MATFDIKQAYEVSVHIDKIITSAASRALLSTGHRLVAHIQNEVIPQAKPQPADRGIYRGGWRAKAIEALIVEVFNKVPHAPIIEYGARAANIKIGRKMLKALEGWIEHKGIASREEAPGVAWAIATNMKKKGIFNNGKGLRVLEKALHRFGKFFGEEYKREIGR